MRAQLLTRLGPVSRGLDPLLATELPDPVPAPGEVLLRVRACGVCRTELDEAEGRLPPPRLPVVPGHQVVGVVEALGEGVSRLQLGERVGVGWIRSACGRCRFCASGDENLCPRFEATGLDANGGYAERMVVPEEHAHPIPPGLVDEEAAPLLCAGAIGWRALRMSGIRDGDPLGLTGFGASAHLVLNLARILFPATPVHVFARSEEERGFARELGAVWAGATDDRPPEPLSAIIDTTPAWRPVVAALSCLAPGGRLVINAIRKEEADQPELLRLRYPEHLWMEKQVRSVANVSRRDVAGILELAASSGAALRPEVQVYPLEGASEALVELREGRIRGAKVLRIGPGGPPGDNRGNTPCASPSPTWPVC